MVIKCINSVNNDGVLTLHLAPSTSSDTDSIIGISAGDKTVTNKCAVIRTEYSASQPSGAYKDATGYNTVEFCASGDDLDTLPATYATTLATHDQLWNPDTGDIAGEEATYITNEVDIGKTHNSTAVVENLQTDIEGLVACSVGQILAWDTSAWSCVVPP